MDANNKPLWSWDLDPAVGKKNCPHCGKPMWTDRASAVQYDGDTYHHYCLLDKLTQFHYDKTRPSPGAAESGGFYGGAWGAP